MSELLTGEPPVRFPLPAGRPLIMTTPLRSVVLAVTVTLPVLTALVVIP